MAHRFPTPDPTDGSGNPPTKRRRLLDTSSSSDESSGWARALNFPQTAYKYRAGVPALKLLPLESIGLDDDSEIYERLEEQMGMIKDRLREYGIDFIDIQWLYRIFPGDEVKDVDLFVLIKAHWTDDYASSDNWIACASFLRRELEALGIYVGVEILAPELYKTKYVSSVESDHGFFNAWTSSIEDQVHTILDEKTLRNKVWSVNVIRLGYNNPPYNPVTILITVDWSMDPSEWVNPQRTIQDTLGRQWEDVCVLFEHGETTFYLDETMTKNPAVAAFREMWERPSSSIVHQVGGTIDPPYDIIRPGASVGGANSLLDADGVAHLGGYGTIGPILKLTVDSGDGKELSGLFAVTCYHVIREWIDGYIIPSEEARGNGPGKRTLGLAKKHSVLSKLDANTRGGFGPTSFPAYTDASKTMKSPAMKLVARALFKKEDLRKSIIDSAAVYQEEDPENRAARAARADAGDVKIRNEMKPLKALIDDEALAICGKVCMGSSPMYRGQKAVGNQNEVQGPRLDYALIKLDDSRLAKVSNELPAKSAYPAKHQVFFDPRMSHLHDIKPLLAQKGKHLFKVGACSGLTAGMFSHFKATVKLPFDGDSLPSHKEFVVVGNAELSERNARVPPFSMKGDSGSAVYNDTGNWVGLVFAGTTVQQTADVEDHKVPLTYVTAAEEIVAHIKSLTFESTKKNHDVKVWSPNATA